MSLYSPPLFRSDDRATLTELVTRHSFAAMVTPAAELLISHLPFSYRADEGPYGTLYAHLARPNPHWQSFGAAESTVIFQGPHDYVSPNWYTDPTANVPTWNYAVAHVHGVAEVMADRRDKRAVLDALVQQYEQGPAPWSTAQADGYVDKLLDGIVAFRLPIARVDVKLKLSQNRPLELPRVIGGLRATGTPNALETADWMERYGTRQSN